MRVTLPRAWIAIVIGACAHSQPPVAPGPPIAADPPIALNSMTDECDGMLAALATFRACPNLDEDNRQNLEAWIERANQDFTAGRKVTLAADAQQAVALACHRASASVVAATGRCRAGRPTKTD